jgi:hypothetical protein
LRKGIIVTLGGLVLLAGCNMGDDTSKVPVKPKWQGARYHIAFDTKATKPNPAGITIPVIKFIANPDMLETRASLVVRFEAPGLKKNDEPVKNQMVMAPADIHGRGRHPSRGLHGRGRQEPGGVSEGLPRQGKGTTQRGASPVVALQPARRCRTEQQASFRLAAGWRLCSRTRIQGPSGLQMKKAGRFAGLSRLDCCL